MRQATEPTPHHRADDGMRNRGILGWDLDGLRARARCSGVGHELHLARLLEGDEEVHRSLDRVGGDENAVVLRVSVGAIGDTESRTNLQDGSL